MKPLRALPILLLISVLCAAQEQAGDALRRKADEASGAECGRLSMQAARYSLEDAHRLFSSGKARAAHEAIDISLYYAERSVECTLQSRKHQKAAEIELRSYIRRMNDVARTVESEDRPHLAKTLAELEKQRDRLLQAIFGPAAANSRETTP
jgi:hypothetical protein